MSQWPQDVTAKKARVVELEKQFHGARAADIVAWASHEFPGTLALANSFGVEDLVLQHLALPYSEHIKSFVLDTGRLPAETYDLVETWRLRFDLRLHLLSPDAKELENFVLEQGPNAFYASPVLRKTCCAIRKLEPLSRALTGQSAWLTGLRREQSQARGDVSVFALDGEARLKLSPLANWTQDEIWNYVETHKLPYNPLHDKGYPSIGCAPCTRSISPGEDFRAGRWWWELDAQKECGLHAPRKETGYVHPSA